MSADPNQVLRILGYRGIDVPVEEGRLVAKPRQGQIPEDMVRFIGHFKEIIVTELEAGKDTSMCAESRPNRPRRLLGKSSGGIARESSDDPSQRGCGAQHRGS